jgi:hypothetical protein
MDNEEMAKNVAKEAYEMAQHRLGPMDKKMFLHIHPDFGPYIGMWDE